MDTSQKNRSGETIVLHSFRLAAIAQPVDGAMRSVVDFLRVF
jgi:hypothetical protein